MNDFEHPEAPPAAEPWLPVETWLVAGSLTLGVVLLVVLLWVSTTWFPIGAEPPA